VIARRFPVTAFGFPMGGEEKPSMETWRRHLQVWWDALVHPQTAGRLVLRDDADAAFERFLCLAIALLYAFYGASMGLFRGRLPAAGSAAKLPFLFLLTLLVCFPALYAANCHLGPRLRVRHCLRLLLLATSANAVALASYAPIGFFFTLTTSRAGYTFLVLMHVFVFAASGLVSLLVLAVVFQSTAREAGRRLRPLFLVAWGALYGFTGMEMAWALRPWIGSFTVPYTLFREREGSFFESVWALLF